MNQPTSVIIDKIRIDNKLFRYMSELENIEDDDRKNLLRKKLRELQNDNKDRLEKAREKINDIKSKIDKSEFKKKWFRLTDDQKNEQIKRYFEKNISDPKERKKEIDRFSDMIKLDTLKNKNIIYNEKDGFIENIDLNKK
jgi:hypothetical protein